MGIIGAVSDAFHLIPGSSYIEGRFKFWSNLGDLSNNILNRGIGTVGTLVSSDIGWYLLLIAGAYIGYRVLM